MPAGWFVNPNFPCSSGPSKRRVLLRIVFKWLAIALLIGALAGTASAGFLIALDWVTHWRESHLWVIALLPLAGFGVGWMYHRFGKAVEGGANLLLDEIHDPQTVVPLRMAPLVLLGTLGTHLFGGSAGREGTAVQMGGSLADQLTHVFRLPPADRKVLLMAGMSAGFASVFGTPLAGVVFGLEVLAVGGNLRLRAILPCIVAAYVGDFVTTLYGVHHTLYAIPSVPSLTVIGLLAIAAAGIAFGFTGRFFTALTHGIGKLAQSRIAYAPLRPMVGGAVVAAVVLGLGATRYSGLGIPVIVESFAHQLPAWDFAAKIALTAVTLGMGFKGGEVTPLFFIGAALGSSLSGLLPLPTPLLAGMGLVAVFAAAARTPLASVVLALELFGLAIAPFAVIACALSFLCSGPVGIYHSKRKVGPNSSTPAV